MADHDSDDEPLTPAQRRVAVLISQLRDDRREPPDDLTERVVRTARWQRAVRGTLIAVGQVTGALTDGLALLVDQRGRRPPPGER